MQRKYLLPLLALMMLAGVNCFASKIIYHSGVAGKSVAFNFPAECVGHQATIWAIGFKRGENITVTLTFKDPSGATISTATSQYNNQYSNNSKTEQAILNFTFPVAAGSYTLELEGNSESENIAQISDTLVICWECPGEDITAIRTELTTEIDDLRNELEGTVDTKIAGLQNQVDSLQAQLNEAIAKHNTDQAELLKQIQVFKNEISNLAADLQYNVARLEQAQAECLAQLESLKTVYQKDVEILNLKIGNLDSKYATEVANIKTDVSEINSDLAAMDAKFSAADQQLKTLISSLESRQTSLQQQLNLAEQQHNADVTVIQTQIDAKTELIRTEHSADVKRLENSIANVDAKHESEVAKLNSEVVRTNSALAQAIQNYTNADSVLQSKIDKLTMNQVTLQNDLAALATEHSRDVAEIRSGIVAADAQLSARHDADVKLLQQSISNLDSRYQASAASLTSALNQTNTQLAQLAKDSTNGDKALQEKIDTLNAQLTAQKNALALLESEHNKDVAALRAESAAKYEQLRIRHEADVSALTQQLSNVNTTYADKVSQINSTLDSISSDLVQMARDYTNGDKELKEQIDTLRLQQLTQQATLSNLKETHVKDVAAIQQELAATRAALQEKIDTEVADLRQDMLALDNKYKDSIADLKNQLANVNSKLESEIAKLSATDRDLYDKISDLREKQADYYARMEILKVTHERDKEAIEKEIAEIDAKYKAEVEAVNTKISAVREDIAKLEAKHNEDVANLRKQIDGAVDNLDDDVKKIYQELDSVKADLAAHQKATQLAIDNLQLQINEIDKSVTERLKNLENRIKYSVYSDEKLEALKKDFEKQIQAKEKEIADLDLEIQEMRNAGRDTSAKEETRIRLLKELVKLRNELTDIEFAIEIRHNESEFAEHEKEIALLKGELAALRNSTDLQIKQLKDELLATEAKYLKLLEEARADAANQTATVQKQLDDLTAKVLAFVDALRRERETGDAELKALIEAMDVSHKDLIANLDKTIADKLEKLRFETDTQFENLRSTINDIAYQQRFSTGGGASGYSLPNSQGQEVPNDSRDLRVSPDAALDSILN